MPNETLPDVNDDLLEAISHGIDNEGALPDGTNQLEDGDETESATEGDAGTDEGTDDDVSGDTETASESDAEADASRPRNADGTFKSAEQIAAESAKPAAKAMEKPGEKPAADANAGKKQPDAINDPIPKDLKQATQERIRTLIDTTKQATERATVVERDFNQIVEGIKSTGTSPEQYGEMLSFMGLFNSGDPGQQKQALEVAFDFVQRLSTMLGVDVNRPDGKAR
jgi:hypothetical protein